MTDPILQSPVLSFASWNGGQNRDSPGYELSHQCHAAQYTEELARIDTQQCSCARTGSRSLSWFTWLGPLSRQAGSLLDRVNKEASHQHIFFEDLNTNIGFGPKGLFYEDPLKISYTYDNECYDSQTMRQAVHQVTKEGLGSFWILGNNCQRFVDRVLANYHQLTSYLR